MGCDFHEFCLLVFWFLTFCRKAELMLQPPKPLQRLTRYCTRRFMEMSEPIFIHRKTRYVHIARWWWRQFLYLGSHKRAESKGWNAKVTTLTFKVFPHKTDNEQHPERVLNIHRLIKQNSTIVHYFERISKCSNDEHTYFSLDPFLLLEGNLAPKV